MSTRQNSPFTVKPAHGGGGAPTRTRYGVVAMAFLLGLVLYVDRAALGVAAPFVRRELNLGTLAMGSVFSAFVFGYALCHIPGGWLGDRLGARRILSAIVVLWSVFTSATSLAFDFGSLLAIRFLFGAAEAGAVPNVSRSFARWIPAEERARAQGIFLAGMSAGGALAPPLVMFIILRWGWKSAFLALGAAGLLWAAAWFLWYRDDPRVHRHVNRAELELLPPASAAPSTDPIPWRRLVKNGNVWAILAMYFTYGYTGYIYITWFPSYLIEGRGLPAMMAGVLSAVPAGLAIVAKPLGGWWSDRLSKRRGVVIGRRVVGMFGFALGAIAVIPGILIPNAYASAIFLGVADAGAALAHGVCFAVCLDVGSKGAGTFSAMMLTAGSIGNALSALAFGAFLSRTGSWIPPFAIACGANLAGSLLWLKIDPGKKVI
jgi:MFS family permease